MSRKPELSRRSALAAMGAAVLGGCSTESGEEPEPTETEEEPTKEEEETQEEPTETEEEPTKEEEETQEEDEGSFTWQDILDHEQQEIERQYEELKSWGNRDILNEALNGEPVGENYRDLDTVETSYSHGGQTWDLDHFTDMDLSDIDDFQDIINDAVTLGIHHYGDQPNTGGPSESSGLAARTAQLLINELIDQGEFEEHNLHMFSGGNDNHGFAYALSEQHGLYLIDSTSERSGKSGAGVLSDRAGYDRIKKYDWNEIEDDIIKIPGISNFVSDTLYTTNSGRRGVPVIGVRYHLDLIPEAMEIFDTTKTDNGEFLMNTLRPAVATLAHEFVKQDLDQSEDVIMIDTESLYDLPDFRDYSEEEFDEYREELNQYTEVIDLEEEGPGQVLHEDRFS